MLVKSSLWATGCSMLVRDGAAAGAGAGGGGGAQEIRARLAASTEPRRRLPRIVDGAVTLAHANSSPAP